MIKDFFHRTRKPIGEFIIETTREMGKCFSRLELASSKLGKRNNDLFESCSFHLGKGSKARATIYANEIAEIRKVISILQHTQLAVERAILRLDTLKVVSPPLESLEEVFGDVKNALGLVSNVMPSITPQIHQLNGVVNEILEGTRFNISVQSPIVTNSPSAKVILQEAANIVEKELKTRIPEPPVETTVLRSPRLSRSLVALATDGSEICIKNDDEESINNSSETFDVSSFILEELVMDYIERNEGDMNIVRCAKELNLSPSKIHKALKILSGKEKIIIQQ